MHRKQFYECGLIVDTAGRLHIDGEMMAEIQALALKAIKPIETLFVWDVMRAKMLANTAKPLTIALPLTGVDFNQGRLVMLEWDSCSVRHIYR